MYPDIYIQYYFCIVKRFNYVSLIIGINDIHEENKPLVSGVGGRVGYTSTAGGLMLYPSISLVYYAVY